jgi:hypothetical protein
MIIVRRAALVAAAALGLAACTDVTQEPLPAELVFASFASPNIPTPNDLALAALITRSPLVNNCGTQFDACAAPPNAQAALLCAFRSAGGFPSDQEVPISVPFNAVTWSAGTAPNGAYLQSAAPAIDTTSINDGNVAVIRVDVTPNVWLKPSTDLEFSSTAGSCSGTPAVCTPAVLTIRKKADLTGSRRWVAGARYVAAVRGGASGVKTTTGSAVQAASAVALALPNRDLTKKENQPLGAIPDSTPAGACGAGSNADEIALLEGVRGALWNPVKWVNPGPTGTFTGAWAPVVDTSITPAFRAVDAAFPHGETASIATFGVALSAGTVVVIDSGSGVAPLPIDLLRTDADGTIVTNPAFGPAAAGLTTLDGFSTTAMMLAQTSGPIDASTVNGGNVFVYRLSGGTATLVPELKAVLGGGGNPATAGYVAQPTPIVTPQGAACPIAGGCSLAIGLQPAVPAPVNASTTIYLPPLRGSTDYAVVITNRVKDVFGNALVKPSVAKILLDFTVPLAVGGVSQIPGVNGPTATALETMRSQLDTVWPALPAGTTKADVVTAYTFRTQSVVNTSLALAAAPYGIEAGAATAIFTPTAATEVTPPPTAPSAGIAAWYEVTFTSIDGIDKTTGAFRPTLASDLGGAGFQALLAPLKALVAVPLAAAVPNACPGTGGTVKCAPLVIVGHGLNGSKETLYALASALASSGLVAAAIDFPLHGERNWCSANSDCDDAGTDGVCTPFTGAAGQGDALPPGTCTTGTTKVFSAPGVNIGSRYFIGANFFRTRDAFRQNVLDQSALGLALARPPAGLAPQPAANPFASDALALGVAVDPTQIFYEGISLGSIAGTSVLATNPRITRASLSVGGGTAADVFTNSPAFQSNIDALFAVLIPGYTRAKITAGDPAFDANIAAAYLKTINVAKWILDPAEPINYAQNVKLAPLPNLLANPNGSVPQSPKAAYGQIAKNDSVVPNPFNLELYNVMAADQTFYDSASAAGGSVPHSMLATTAQVQIDAAGYLLGVVPPATRTLP